VLGRISCKGGNNRRLEKMTYEELRNLYYTRYYKDDQMKEDEMGGVCSI
jgi:hypothetical protein